MENEIELLSLVEINEGVMKGVRMFVVGSANGGSSLQLNWDIAVLQHVAKGGSLIPTAKRYRITEVESCWICKNDVNLIEGPKAVLKRLRDEGWMTV